MFTLCKSLSRQEDEKNKFSTNKIKFEFEKPSQILVVVVEKI